MGGTQETPLGGRATDPEAASSREWDEPVDDTAGWELWLGPGVRFDGLAAVLDALGPLAHDAPSAMTRLDDLEEVALLDAPARGRLVLDADALALEDLGYVRRFVERNPGFELVLCGDEVGRGAARRLYARHGVRWVAWPPDLFELEGLCAPPRDVAAFDEDEVDDVRLVPHARPRDVERTPRTAAQDELDSAFDEEDDDRAPRDAPLRAASQPPHAARATRPASRGPGVGADESRELAAIQAVLDLPPLAGGLELDQGGPDPFGALLDAPAPLAGSIEDDTAVAATGLDPFARAHTDPFAARVAPPLQPAHVARRAEPSPAASAPPAYYRAQVADLADIAQRVDLALRALRPEPDRAAAPDDGYEPLAAEVARLLQFTRTLSYLVAPPPRGAQTFDLGVLVEELLDQTVALGPGAARCAFRRADGLTVRSDKGLLVQALDAFVMLALACAGPGELVRVQVRALRDADHAVARLSLEFPSGPLADLAPERVAEPYALKACVPSLGPNALSAASGIVIGQGGAVRLAALGDGRLELVLDLPLA